MNEREERARETARNLANAVNEMGFDVDVFADELLRQHRTLQQDRLRRISGDGQGVGGARTFALRRPKRIHCGRKPKNRGGPGAIQAPGTVHLESRPEGNWPECCVGGESMSRERINVSLTVQGLELLDREREKMGLSRSAFFEVLLRFWVRDEPVVAQVRAAPDASAPRMPRRRKQGKAAR